MYEKGDGRAKGLGPRLSAGPVSGRSYDSRRPVVAESCNPYRAVVRMH